MPPPHFSDAQFQIHRSRDSILMSLLMSFPQLMSPCPIFFQVCHTPHTETCLRHHISFGFLFNACMDFSLSPGKMEPSCTPLLLLRRGMLPWACKGSAGSRACSLLISWVETQSKPQTGISVIWVHRLRIALTHWRRAGSGIGVPTLDVLWMSTVAPGGSVLVHSSCL